MAAFRVAALLLAAARGDRFAMDAATRPADVAELLRLAEGRRRVVELGTAVGWTAAAFVLADPARTLVSFDPVVQAGRNAYLHLLPRAARKRVELIAAPGALGAAGVAPPVDLVFVDASHERDATVEEVRAWWPRLAPGGLLVLHDYGNPAFPGVSEAVAMLDLRGEVREGMFVAVARDGR